jgi:hypothetical protein
MTQGDHAPIIQRRSRKERKEKESGHLTFKFCKPFRPWSEAARSLNNPDSPTLRIQITDRGPTMATFRSIKLSADAGPAGIDVI